jgi:uncharacterized protein DUF4382
MRQIIYFLAALISAVAVVYSCGGGSGGGGGGGTETGKTALFITDDPADSFDAVKLKITQVKVENTGNGNSCVLFNSTNAESPLPVNLTELNNVLLLLSETNCKQESFNRLRIDFNQDVIVGKGDTSSICQLTSFKQEGSSNVPNLVHCDNMGSCFVEINGAVNVLANQFNKIALDFVLKDSDVENFPNSNCTVTFKTSPINASEKEVPELILGGISGLNVNTHTFTLTEGAETFSVDYSSVTQTGIDNLLGFAQSNNNLDNLAVEVQCSTLDFTTNQCTASEISVELEGSVQHLQDNNTFDLIVDASHTITVKITTAKVIGTISNGVDAEVTLNGFDSMNSVFIAAEVVVK